MYWVVSTLYGQRNMDAQQLLTSLTVGFEEVQGRVPLLANRNTAQAIQIGIIDPFRSPVLLQEKDLGNLPRGFILAQVLRHMKEPGLLGILQLVQFKVNVYPIPWLSRREDGVILKISRSSLDHMQGT